MSIDSTGGNAALVTLMLVLLLVGAGVFLWTYMRAEHELAIASDRAHELELAQAAERSELEDAQLEEAGNRALPEGVPDEATVLKSFEGTGSIRGRVFTPPGVPFPESWQLVVEPSLYLEGKESAVRRVLELSGDELEFEVPDLPMGGYRVQATATGMESPPRDVLVFRSVRADGRLASPTEYPYVTIELLPEGFIDGIVHDEEGLAVEGLMVTVENVDSGERITTETQPNGTYLLEPVGEGEYTITFGDPDRPLIPAQSILFTRSGGSSENAPRPSLRYPDQVVPRTASILVIVVDEIPARIPGARIEGFGNVSGRLAATTDADGEARLRYLPPGRYHLDVTHGSGRRGKVDFELAGNERDKVVEVMCTN